MAVLTTQPLPKAAKTSGVSVAQNGVIDLAGTSTSFGGGFQDAFVVSVQANGEAGSAATRGGPGLEF